MLDLPKSQQERNKQKRTDGTSKKQSKTEASIPPKSVITFIIKNLKYSY